MLSRFDDYPIHQTSEPIKIPETTDRHVYDRYWFNGYSKQGDFYFGIGAALYPNLGIMDCGFSLVIDGEQHAFHASRVLSFYKTSPLLREFSTFFQKLLPQQVQEPASSARVLIF